MNSETTAFYTDNCQQASLRIKALSRQANTISFFRLLIILGGATLLFQVVQTENVLWTLFSFLGILVLFLVLVRYQSQVSSRKKEEEHFLHINKNELNVAENTTSNVYRNGQDFHDDRHIYTSDLDIFGEGSIFQLVNRCATVEGNKVLASWLSRPADKHEIQRRQQFVEELVQDYPWWQGLQAKLYAVHDSTTAAKKIISTYLVDEIKFPTSAVLAGYTRVVPYLSALFFLLSIYQASLTPFFILFMVFNLLLSMSLGKYVHAISTGLSKGGNFLAYYVPALQQMEERNWRSEKAQGLKNDMEQVTGMPVSKAIDRLSVLLNRLDARLNMVVGIVLNLLFVWDLRQVYALRKWQREQSKGILEAMDMLSTVEATGSLASLKFNHKDWVMPEISEEFPVMEVENARHPLLPILHSVANDYHLKAHRIALITGSNMAGKSTFLRTIGVNAVLAFAGAPVCASAMRASVVQLASYMRIRDSLNESTSTFKAELDRIQQVLELVKNNDHTFILLDEMLRGTNSMDKYLGSKAIIEKLIHENGVGMVATHDLQLAELSEKYPLFVKNYHFDIQVIQDEMRFDYKLKQGPCTTFNASLLLKKIGIEI